MSRVLRYVAIPVVKVYFSGLTRRRLQIPQLYLHHEASAKEPPSILKGFSDVTLEPGQSTFVKIQLNRFDLSVWDVVGQSWARPSADSTWGISIGASSRDFRLNGVIPI